MDVGIVSSECYTACKDIFFFFVSVVENVFTKNLKWFEKLFICYKYKCEKKLRLFDFSLQIILSSKINLNNYDEFLLYEQIAAYDEFHEIAQIECLCCLWRNGLGNLTQLHHVSNKWQTFLLQVSSCVDHYTSYPNIFSPSCRRFY